MKLQFDLTNVAYRRLVRREARKLDLPIKNISAQRFDIEVREPIVAYRLGYFVTAAYEKELRQATK